MPKIRPSEPEDAGAIAAVILPIQQTEFDIPITIEAQPDLSDIASYYQHGCGNFWVAEVDGRIVGTIGLLDIGNGDAALRKTVLREERLHRSHPHGVAPVLPRHDRGHEVLSSVPSTRLRPRHGSNLHSRVAPGGNVRTPKQARG